jgi:hypothetical protein
MYFLSFKFIISLILIIQLSQYIILAIEISNLLSNNDRVIVVYYPDWKRQFLAENNLPWSKITHVNYGICTKVF